MFPRLLLNNNFIRAGVQHLNSARYLDELPDVKWGAGKLERVGVVGAYSLRRTFVSYISSRVCT